MEKIKKFKHENNNKKEPVLAFAEFRVALHRSLGNNPGFALQKVLGDQMRYEVL